VTVVPEPDFDDAFTVGTATVEAFRRDGHVCVRGLAAAAEVAAVRPAIEAAAARRTTDVAPLEERDTYGKAFLQAINLWRLDDAVRRFVFGRRFAGVAAALLGVDGVRLYHDQALIKEAGGGHTPWHQDQTYWPLDGAGTVTMWMPLVDVTEEIGTMTFASGSHRLGDLRTPGISDETEAAFAAAVRDRGLRTATHGALAAGDATFHAGWTLHRAPPNPTSAVRPVMTVIYFADGTRVAEPVDDFQRFDLALWLKGLAPGDLAASERNPLLYP
jgi:ectoine hydroxylase-related dioxygenase (phytanoyl-CoA dioxygenase family)